MATLTVPSTVPSVADDCEQLRKAFKGWGTNEKLIISILAHRDAAQRRGIRRAYAEAYGEELFRALDDEIHGNFELFVVRQAYHEQFKRSIEEDVAAYTTGDFRKLFVPLVSTYRYDGPEVNTTLAHSEAKILHEKIHQKAYSDHEIIRILTTRSKAQLLATFNHYNAEFGHPINEDLRADPNDEFLATVRAVIRCFSCPERYFEKVLRLALGGMGTDEKSVTRVITTRAEVDLKLIKEAYQKRNSTTLERAVAKGTTRDYEDMLLALLGQE